MKNLLISITILLLLNNSSEAFNPFKILFDKKQKVDKVFLDTSLDESAYKLDKYPNILGYKNNEYLLLYGGNGKVWLMDMFGKKYREWKTDIKRARLLKNCNLMVIDTNLDHYIAEKNTQGEIQWKYDTQGPTHHDLEVSDNGNIITFLYRKALPEDVEIDIGCKNSEIFTDSVLQINRNGDRLFEWQFHEHFLDVLKKQQCDSKTMQHMKHSDYASRLDWTHPNAVNVLKDNKWYRKGHKEFRPGNILVTVHHFSKIMLIDRESSEVVWSYEGDDDYPLEHSHEAKMIPKGYPGAGNILIFDNGHLRKYTRVIEIDPITKKTLWVYQDPGKFYSIWAGSHQRLKNRDTFISDDMSGRAFIVNRQGKIKWQFTKDGEKWVKRAHLYLKKDFAHCIDL